MKKLLYVSILIFVAVISIGHIANAQGTGTLVQLQQFVSTTSPVSGITQQSYGKSLILTGLTASSNLCLDSNNRVTTTGCSGGSGGGADGNLVFFNNSGIKLATTTNSVLIGASATSTRSQLEVNAQAGITPFYVGSSSPYFIVGSTGNVGVGTTTPGAKLDVISTAGYTGSGGEPTYPGVIRINSAQGTESQVGGLEFKASVSGGGYGGRISMVDLGTGEVPMYFQTRANSATWTNRMTLLNGGNLGIGTTTPGYKLSVAGSAYFDGGTVIASNFIATSSFSASSFTLTGIAVNSLLSTNASGVIVATSTPTFGNFNATSTTATSTIGTGGLAVGGSQFVVQQNSGKVGIGTLTPQDALSVFQRSGQAGFGVYSAVNSNRQTFKVTTTSNHGLAQILDASEVLSIQLDAGGTLGSYVKNGNFGIGTAAPSAKLDVSGGDFLLSTDGKAILSVAGTTYFKPASTNSNQLLQLTPSGSATESTIRLHGQLSTSVGTRGEFQQSGANTIIRNQTLGAGAQGYITFDQDAISRLRIDTSGNVGIGTTSPNTKFNIFVASSTAGTVQTNPFGRLMEMTIAGVYYMVETFDYYGHLITSGPAPTLSSCGTTPSVTGNDRTAIVTVGSVSATGCTITFAKPYASAPSCVVTNQSMSVVNAMTYTVSATAITVSQTGLTEAILNYNCLGIR